MKKQMICILILLLLAVPSHAALIFSTFGLGDTYDLTIGWSIGGQYDVDEGFQFSFAAPTSYYLDKIELAVGLMEGTNELDVWLMNDDSGKPGSIIEAFNFKDAMEDTWNESFLVGNSVLHPILSPGTNYWLVGSAPNSDTRAIWYESLPAVTGERAYRPGTSSWQIDTMVMGAFRVSGSPVPAVPAPGAVILTDIGIGLFGWLRRRKTI